MHVVVLHVFLGKKQNHFSSSASNKYYSLIITVFETLSIVYACESFLTVGF